MTFNDLEKLSVISNNLNWCTLVWDTPNPIHSRLSAEANSKTKNAIHQYVAENPSHPICNVVKAPATCAEEATNNLEQSRAILQQYYAGMRNENRDADDTYFALFDLVVHDTKLYMDAMGIDHRDLHHLSGDHNLCDRATIHKIVSSMVDTSQSVMASAPHTNPVPQGGMSYAKGIPAMVDHFKNISMYTSENNGSFMIPADATNARVHIKMKDSEVEKSRSIFHEYGHGIYQANILSTTYAGRLGLHLSLSLHESSAIFAEIALGGIDNAFNKNHHSNLFRLGSDKLHYIIHVYIRMIIEDQLFSGEIVAKDIPSRWNELMVEYVGMAPENNWDGFLQDVHWNDGSFGYFHSYAIGFLNAVDMLSSVEHRLIQSDTTSCVYTMNTVIIPTIQETYGFMRDADINLLGIIHPNIDETLSRYHEFISSRFYNSEKV